MSRQTGPAVALVGVLLLVWGLTFAQVLTRGATAEVYPMSVYPMFSTGTDADHDRYYAVVHAGNATATLDAADLFDAHHTLEAGQSLRLMNAVRASAKAGCPDLRFGYAGCSAAPVFPWKAPPGLASLWLRSAAARTGLTPDHLVLMAETTHLNRALDDPQRVERIEIAVVQP